MRIGIMGGTFNPIHFGHLTSAEEISKRFMLDQVIFIPTYITPYKERSEILDSERRLDMLKLAVKSNRIFSVSTVETDRGGVSYSVDTLQDLQGTFSAESSFYFITGTDVFTDIAIWKDPEKLFMNCHFIVNTRLGYQMDDIMLSLKKNITAKYCHLCFEHQGRDTVYEAEKIAVSGSPFFIYTIKTTPLNISSTIIRKRVADGKAVKDLLPEQVETYILKNRLYRR